MSAASRTGRVLVARMDNDGDVLLAGPAIRAVAASAGEVTLLCGPRGAQAAGLLAGVQRVLVHEAAWIDPDPWPFRAGEVQRLLAALSELEVEEAIILTSFHQSPLPLALLLRLAGVPRIGAISPDYPGALLDVRHQVAEEIHEVQRSLSLVGAMGHRLPEGDDGALAVEGVGPAAIEAARPFPASCDYVVLHPGASVPARAWSSRRYAQLLRGLLQQGWQVAVTGGPRERELTGEVIAEALTAVSPAAAQRVRDLGGATDLPTLAAVIAGAAAIVVGNTGPAHLAAALGTPVASLFALTISPARWRPWLVRHELLCIEVPCAGCRARDCQVKGHPCVDGVAPAEVLEAIERLTRVRSDRGASQREADLGMRSVAA